MKPYLVFSLHNVQYGIDASLVKEVFLLPELTAIAQAPKDIVGAIDLRSKVVPVMHLAVRLGYRMPEGKLSDSVVILEWQGLQIGIIVNSVSEVKNIESSAIEPEISYGRVRRAQTRFLLGVAKVDTDMIMLLDPENLIGYSEEIEEVISFAPEAQENLNGEFFGQKYLDFEPEKPKSELNNFYELCCPSATSEERAIFRQRTENLRTATENSEFVGQLPVAVVGLNGEYFGLDLGLVREFTNIRQVTPIPCCPPHIIGNMNLRGEIVTLVDIRGTLNLPLPDVNAASKAVVIQVDDIVAAIPVDRVFDVMYLHPSDLTAPPTAVNGDEFLRGTAPYLGKMLSVIDLPNLLDRGGLVVNEEV
ncbi:MAG: chemotaxis protein CheW [Cyanosarcina radialis HA8281-LM2]|jgi:purine-binding chemotaxis protein CheW|nr:chemotaxis protein CheW [Cyanosarcina radialis HA8281-LM2]